MIKRIFNFYSDYVEGVEVENFMPIVYNRQWVIMPGTKMKVMKFEHSTKGLPMNGTSVCDYRDDYCIALQMEEGNVLITNFESVKNSLCF